MACLSSGVHCLLCVLLSCCPPLFFSFHTSINLHAMVAVAATFATANENVKARYITTDAAVLMSKATKEEIAKTLDALAGADVVVRTMTCTHELSCACTRAHTVTIPSYAAPLSPFRVLDRTRHSLICSPAHLPAYPPTHEASSTSHARTHTHTKDQARA